MSDAPRPHVGLATATAVGLIQLYRLSLSWFLGGNCRFYPSCSIYAQQALRTHGLKDGLRLAACRLLCCHPWHRGGYDPVPGSEENKT